MNLLHTYGDITGPLIYDDPKITSSILANIPAFLRKTIEESLKKFTKDRLLISSNSLANSFILERWGIRPSQRRRYKVLFVSVRKESRNILHHYLSMRKIQWRTDGVEFVFGVYKYDEVRSNLILSFRDMSHIAFWV